MKQNITKLALLLATLACSCEYEKLPTYSGQDQIYFAYADGMSINMTDEQFLHFGYDEPMKPETTLYVSVKVMGSVADVDRPVSFVLVDSQSTARMNRDLELLPALSLVPAGKALGVVAIKLKNTTALRDTVLEATFRLVENECFHTDYTKTRYPNVNSEGKIVSTVYRVRFDNAASMPRLWVENLDKCTQMFGEFSEVKFDLMCRLLGFDKSYFSYDDGEDPLVLFDARINLYSQSWVRTVNRYLNEYREINGRPMVDEHGKEVKMGTSSIS
ncbi:MAG: DUF4843 domain-containing protein [Prevotellaceae bacterium]|jgi:hypothetical protein|nr:DUF4843 domain-containing protein [Prevotellaceae bacterium]